MKKFVLILIAFQLAASTLAQIAKDSVSANGCRVVTTEYFSCQEDYMPLRMYASVGCKVCSSDTAYFFNVILARDYYLPAVPAGAKLLIRNGSGDVFQLCATDSVQEMVKENNLHYIGVTYGMSAEDTKRLEAGIIKIRMENVGNYTDVEASAATSAQKYGRYMAALRRRLASSREAELLNGF